MKRFVKRWTILYFECLVWKVRSIPPSMYADNISTSQQRCMNCHFWEYTIVKKSEVRSLSLVVSFLLFSAEALCTTAEWKWPLKAIILWSYWSVRNNTFAIFTIIKSVEQWKKMYVGLFLLSYEEWWAIVLCSKAFSGCLPSGLTATPHPLGLNEDLREGVKKKRFF